MRRKDTISQKISWTTRKLSRKVSYTSCKRSLWKVFIHLTNKKIKSPWDGVTSILRDSREVKTSARGKNGSCAWNYNRLRMVHICKANQVSPSSQFDAPYASEGGRKLQQKVCWDCRMHPESRAGNQAQSNWLSPLGLEEMIKDRHVSYAPKLQQSAHSAEEGAVWTREGSSIERNPEARMTLWLFANAVLFAKRITITSQSVSSRGFGLRRARRWWLTPSRIWPFDFPNRVRGPGRFWPSS